MGVQDSPGRPRGGLGLSKEVVCWSEAGWEVMGGYGGDQWLSMWGLWLTGEATWRSEAHWWATRGSTRRLAGGPEPF